MTPRSSESACGRLSDGRRAALEETRHGLVRLVLQALHLAALKVVARHAHERGYGARAVVCDRVDIALQEKRRGAQLGEIPGRSTRAHPAAIEIQACG